MTHTVTIERTYDASPAALWAAWMDLQRLTKWWGCAPDQLWNVHEWSPVPGGGVKVSMDFDGQPYVVEGRFVDVEEPHLLRFEWEGGQVITVTIGDDDDDGHTSMTVEHAGLPDEFMRDTVTAGWSSSVEQIRSALI